jgi:replicative DNA helicase
MTQLPHNQEAEEAVVGALLVDPDLMLEVSEVLRPEDFWLRRYGDIYAAMLRLHADRKPVDIINLGEMLPGQNGQLMELIRFTGQVYNVPHYAGIVRELSIKRQLALLSGEIAKISHDRETTSDEALQGAADLLHKLSTDNMQHRPEAVSTYASRLDDTITAVSEGRTDPGIPTGIIDLDRLLKGGLKRGKLYLIAGRPGMGKSALAVQMAATISQTLPALYISREMPGEEIALRIISGLSAVDSGKIETATMEGDEYQKYYDTLHRMQSLNLQVDVTSQTVQAIANRATLQASRGLSVLFVDYIQRVTTSNKRHGNRDEAIGEISNSLKDLAMDLNIPVVAISSLSRRVEQRPDKRPMLSDLRESGSLEFDADVVMSVFRDEVYTGDGSNVPGTAEIGVIKHRGGALGMIQTYFRKHTTTFLPLETRRVPL